jgi:hypothetical protein
MKKSKTISAKELEDKFDRGEDVLEHFDVRKAKMVAPHIQRVNVDFPVWMVRRLDLEATRLGITRQALIKTWIGAELDQHHAA